MRVHLICVAAAMTMLSPSQSDMAASASFLDDDVPDKALWPAFNITLEDFEAANGSTLAGWKRQWESMEISDKPYNLHYAAAGLLELKELVLEDPQAATNNWQAGRHPCDFSQVLCNQFGVVIGVDLSAPQQRSAFSQSSNASTLRLGALPDGLSWRYLAQMSLEIVSFRHIRLDVDTLPDWSQFSKLRELSLAGLKLQGTLPAAFSSLTDLERLDARDNNFHGELPRAWSSMQNLQLLDLSITSLPSAWKISSSLPSAWKDLQRLCVLDLSNQNISGPLPAAWSILPWLQIAVFENAKISGEWPRDWSEMQNLTTLNLAGTLVSGSLPNKRADIRNSSYADVQPHQNQGHHSPKLQQSHLL